MRGWVRIGLVLSAVMAPPALAEERASWVQNGLEFYRLPPPVTDRDRAAEQMAAGCASGAIRFGETASLRGQGPAVNWPKSVRRQVAAAAITDDADQADELLTSAMATPGLPSEGRAILANRRILTALQFGQNARAAALLSEPASTAEWARPLRADRALWTAMANDRASPERWRSEYGPLLDQAFRDDPSSFGIRAWRVIAWLKARAWESEPSCRAAIGALSERVLDLSEAGTCPVMLSHMEYALARHLGSTQPSVETGESAIWQDFTAGLIAILSQHAPALGAARDRLLMQRQTSCADDVATELSLLARSLMP